MNIENTGEKSSCLLEWRVHLMQTDSRRMPVLILAVCGATACVWLMFRSWLPAAAAILLLLGATREYLFPLTYRMTSEGVFVNGLLIQSAITWQDARRILPDTNGVILTPLATPSRLDAFRGVCIRFAPEGQPGDRSSVTEIIGEYTERFETDCAASEEGN